MNCSILQRVAILSIAAGMLVSAAMAEGACDSIQAADAARLDTVFLVHAIPQQPHYSDIERNVYWSTWWGYHVSFISDFTTTGMIIDRGGREGDPLYTQFGERNMAGVIGSGVAFHAVFTVISYTLYRAAGTRHGAWRFLFYAAATGITSYFLSVHTYATFGNISLYNRLSR